MPSRYRSHGQGMVEYTVILVFGVLLLMGPGGDVLSDLLTVMQNKYRGYSYAMSLSPLPDFGTGPRLQNYIEGLGLDPAIDDATMERLTVDPIQAQVDTALAPISNAYQTFSDVGDMLGDLDSLDDIAAEMLQDAISPF